MRERGRLTRQRDRLAVVDGDAILSPAWALPMGASMTGENPEHADLGPMPVSRLG